MSDNHPNFAIFPFLRTSAPICIRGLCFRSVTDTEGLEPECKEHLSVLTNLFYLRHGYKINDMMYCHFHSCKENNYAADSFERLRQAHLLISYLYAHPEDWSGKPFLSAECTDIFAFTPYDVFRVSVQPSFGVTAIPGFETWSSETDQKEPYVAGYLGIRNFTERFSIVKGQGIYPYSYEILINHNQDLHEDLGYSDMPNYSWAIKELIHSSDLELVNLEQRIFTALGWYRRCCRQNISPDEELAHLAIALESLLKIEGADQQGIRKRFEETIITLLGNLPRLDSWVRQFYDARSDIVHEGSSEWTSFYALPSEKIKDLKANRLKEEEKFQRGDLAGYGRKVFRLCLNLILTGSRLEKLANLQEILLHDNERLQRICKALRESKSSDADSLIAVANEVRSLGSARMGHLNIPDSDLIGATSREILNRWMRTNPALSDHGRIATDEIAANQFSDKNARWSAYSTLCHEFDNRQRIIGKKPMLKTLTEVVQHYFQYAHSELFRL